MAGRMSKRQMSSEEIFRRDLNASMQAASLSRRGRPSVSEHSQRLTAFGISLSTTISDVILVYPCVVLRRQCQVNNVGRRYHFTPFTIVSVALRMQRGQGLTCLWKGIGSHLIVSAMTFGIESGISEANHKFPREIHGHSSMKEVGGHFLLKILSASLTLPFYSAHLIESIQSEAASEPTGLFYCFKEGFSRLLGIGGVQSPRLLPLRYLLLPTVLHLLLRYVLSSVLQYAILHAIKIYDKWNHERHLVARAPLSTPTVDYMSVPGGPIQDSGPLFFSVDSAVTHVHTQQREMWAGYVADLVTDIALYPLECAVNRLHVQGTRTIIDDMDRGSGFLPVSSRYEGFFDCISSIKSQEGRKGFYRGFGTLILQHLLKFCVVKLMTLGLTFSSAKPSRK